MKTSCGGMAQVSTHRLKPLASWDWQTGTPSHPGIHTILPHPYVAIVLLLGISSSPFKINEFCNGQV